MGGSGSPEASVGSGMQAPRCCASLALSRSSEADRQDASVGGGSPPAAFGMELEERDGPPCHTASTPEGLCLGLEEISNV